MFSLLDTIDMGRFEQLFPGTGVPKVERVFKREGILAANDAAMIARMEKNNRLQALRMAKQAQEASAIAIRRARGAKRDGDAAAR